MSVTISVDNTRHYRVKSGFYNFRVDWQDGSKAVMLTAYGYGGPSVELAFDTAHLDTLLALLGQVRAEMAQAAAPLGAGK